MPATIKIGTLISGGGTNLQAIIDACQNKDIDADVVFTGSDVPGVKGLDRAQKAGIETFVVDYAKIIAGCRQNGITADDLPADFNLEEIYTKQRLTTSDMSADEADFFPEKPGDGRTPAAG